MRGRWLALAWVLIAGASTVTGATEYFVDFDATPDSGCSDAGAGADPRAGGTPWCTLPGTRTATNAAFLPGPWARIRAGDTISIKAGTTHTASGGGIVLVDPAHYDGGSAAARILIRKHPTWGSGAYAVLDGAGMSGRLAGVVTDLAVDYVTFDGLEIAHPPEYGFQLEHDADHIVIDHAFVHDGATTGALVYVSGCTTAPCQEIVRNSTVANASNGGGIFVYDNPGGHVLVENNVVHHVCGGAGNYDGIQCGASDGTTNYCAVRNNVVYAHGSHSGYVGCPSAGSDPIDVAGQGCRRNELADGNVVYDASGEFKVHGTYGDDCPGAPLESYNIARRNRLTNVEIVSYSFPNDTIFYNNTQYNPDVPVNVQLYSSETSSPPGESSGTDAYAVRALAVGHDVDFARLTFKNNIMWGQTSFHVQLNGVPGYREDVRYSSLRFYGDLYDAFHGIYWYPDELAQDPTFYASWASYRASRASDAPDTDSILSSAPASAVFVDAAHGDYRLVAGSPAIDAGVPITRAVGDSAAGAGSLVLVVERASFVDGYDGLFEPDHIAVGSCADVAIVDVDDANATIVLASPCRWHDGDPVNLAYQGSAPDIGAFEFGVAATATPSAAPTPAATPTPTTGEELACPVAPAAGCRRPIAPRKSRIQLSVHPARPAKDQLAWTWTHGAVTTKADFGDPLGADGYALCIYDGEGLAYGASVPAGGLCAGKPCWRERHAGFSYHDKTLGAHGIEKLTLTQGLAPGKAAIAFRGRGARLAPPDPPSVSAPIAVQLLRTAGPCWEAVFGAPFRKQDATRLRDDSD